MMKRFLISILLVLVFIVPLATSCCGGSEPQATNKPSNEPAPPPDYKAVDHALQDPNGAVRLEAVRNLATMKHPNTIPRLIKVVVDHEPTAADNDFSRDILNTARASLISFGEESNDLVKKELWNSQSYGLQKVGFEVLSAINKPETFIKEAKKRFDILPKDESTISLRAAIVSYYVGNFQDLKAKDQSATPSNAPTNAPVAPANTPVNEQAGASAEPLVSLVDLITFLNEPEGPVHSSVISRMQEWKDPEVAVLLKTFYFNNLKNDPAKARVLAVLNYYDDPLGAENKAPIDDITVFLYSFGSYDKPLHTQAYEGLKKFAYNDKDGKISAFLNQFQNCSDPVIKANAMEIVRNIETKVPKEGQKAPEFTIPQPLRRENICLD